MVRVVDKGEEEASAGFTLRFDVGKKPSHGRAIISGAQPGGRLLRLAVWLQSLSPVSGTGKLWAPLAARALEAGQGSAKRGANSLYDARYLAVQMLSINVSMSIIMMIRCCPGHSTPLLRTPPSTSRLWEADWPGQIRRRYGVLVCLHFLPSLSRSNCKFSQVLRNLAAYEPMPPWNQEAGSKGRVKRWTQ